MKRTPRIALILSAIGLCVCLLGSHDRAWAQPYTHVVEEGDTLWDICEKYYGDSELWPKLWQLNPFVTNPHLLKPGDVITLLEEVPIKIPEPVEEKEVVKPEEIPEEEAEEKVEEVNGIDLTKIIHAQAAGFLAVEKIQPLGSIFSTEADKVLIARGDKVYLARETRHPLTPGKDYTLYDQSPLQKHPLSKDELGYIITYLGKVHVIEVMNNFLYKAEIVEVYREVHIGDFIIPYEPHSACIQPAPMPRKINTHIVAVQDRLDLIGQFSVVYLDHGYDHDIRKGQLFEVVQKREIEKPKKMVLPDIILGHLLIVDTKPKKSTGVVLASQKEFHNGAFVRGIDWSDARNILLRIPTCQ